jgi:aminopeptidase N
LFHQWFGDYVTAESWSNLTVNESFADYSQLLWLEYKYGADEAGFENFNEMSQYMSNAAENKKHLVRFYYNDKEDMFDLVSYQKGGRILHMLRNFVGDDAFFKSLNKYLTDK